MGYFGALLSRMSAVRCHSHEKTSPDFFGVKEESVVGSAGGECYPEFPQKETT